MRDSVRPVRRLNNERKLVEVLAGNTRHTGSSERTSATRGNPGEECIHSSRISNGW